MTPSRHNMFALSAAGLCFFILTLAGRPAVAADSAQATSTVSDIQTAAVARIKPLFQNIGAYISVLLRFDFVKKNNDGAGKDGADKETKEFNPLLKMKGAGDGVKELPQAEEEAGDSERKTTLEEKAYQNGRKVRVYFEQLKEKFKKIKPKSEHESDQAEGQTG